MPASMNRATILGYLGADPQITNFSEGGRVANLSVATSESWKDRDNGETQTRTEWHKVVIYAEPLIALAEKALHKGSKILLEGALQTRKYDKDNVNHSVTEIVLRPYSGSLTLLDAPKQAPEPARPAPKSNQRRTAPSGPRAA